MSRRTRSCAPPVGSGPVHHGGPATQQKRQRHHGRDTDDGDDQMRLAPANGFDQVLQDRRPDGAGEIVAACHHGDGDPAPARKPVRHVGDQRAECHRRAEKPDQHTLGQNELPHGCGMRCRRVAQSQHHRTADDRQHDAETVGNSSHDNAASGRADHGGEKRQGSAAAVDPEFRFDSRQCDHHRPQADTADGAQRHRDGKPPPGIATVPARARCAGPQGRSCRRGSWHPGRGQGKWLQSKTARAVGSHATAPGRCQLSGNRRSGEP